MRPGCHHLTREQQLSALTAAVNEPGRPWADIARELGTSRWSVFRYLRRQLGRRQGTDDWQTAVSRGMVTPPVLAEPVRLQCPSCDRPIPPIPEGCRYRCPCGRLLADQQGAA